MKKTIPMFGAGVVALLLASAALAQGTQVLWKLVDKKGRVTYADQPPKDFDGVVTRIEVPLDARSASPSAPPPARPGASGAAAPGPAAGNPAGSGNAGAELEKARARLEEARRALESGKEPGPDDVVWVGRKGGGARPEISEAYAARVKKLEDAVRASEAEVERLERGAR